MPDPTALFEPVDSGAWMPTPWAVGPWSPDALHGGPVAALLAGEAERAGDEAAPDGVEFQPTRVSIELLRPVPVAPLAARATVVRPGRMVQLVDAELRLADGTVVATARVLRIRTTDIAGAPVTTDIAPPPGPDGLGRMTPTEGPGPAFHSHGVEHRIAAGVFGEPGPATDWIRLRVPVVAGEGTTPLQRVAAAADFGNGLSAVADWNTLLFINPDLTLHLHRLPAGEWVCIDAVTWMEATGVAMAESRLWDERGPLGRALQSLVVDTRGGTNP